MPPKVYLPKPEKGELHGYHLHEHDTERHAALDRAIAHDGAVTVIRRLNVLRIFNKEHHPEYYDIITRDMEYVERKRGTHLPASRSKSHKSRKSKSTKSRKSKSRKSKSRK